MNQSDLRARAEESLRITGRELGSLSKHDIQRLVHELQVHQVELEMQNDALRTSQLVVEDAQAQYQELFDSAPVGYVLLDPNGRVVQANRIVLELFRVEKSQLLGQPLQGFVRAEDAPSLEKKLGGAPQRGRVHCEVGLRADPDGSIPYVQLDISAKPSRAGHRLITLTDVTERKRGIEALERLNEELERRVSKRTTELAARNRELEAEIAQRAESEAKRRGLEQRLREAQHFDSLGVLAGGLAHDFNNLLVGVLGNAELLLLKAGLDLELRESLEMIKRTCRRASDLTRQLLAFAGHGPRSLTALKLPHVVADNLEVLRTRLPKGVQLETQINNDVPAIKADRAQVNQVVMNLVTNAVEAVAGAGVISLQVSSATLDDEQLGKFQHCYTAVPGPFVVFGVRDSGPGIDTAIVPRIFDPFFSTKFAGRGLGLASVLGIVQSHNAAIRVHTAPGAGASFEVAFPVAERRIDSDQPRPPSELEWRGSGSVLLVDDDDGVRTVIAKLLTILGFDVTTANGGEQGLQHFQRGNARFDFVMLDWIMPGFSGEQLLKALRALDQELPIILISGYSGEDLETRDERVVFLQKPMALAQLRAAISKLLGDTHALRPQS